LANNKLKELGHSENDLWDLFEGDILIGLTDLKYKETKHTSYEKVGQNMPAVKIEKIKKEILPQFIIAATIYKKETANKVLRSLEEQGLVVNHGHYYKLATSNSDYFFTVSDKILIITNDETFIQNQSNGYPENERLPKDVQDHFLSNSFSMYFNIERVLSKMPRDTTYELYDNLFPGSIQSLKPKGNFLSNNVSSSKMILNLVNKTNNSLYEVFRLINQAYIISIKR
jgi:hypothetical protein